MIVGRGKFIVAIHATDLLDEISLYREIETETRGRRHPSFRGRHDGHAQTRKNILDLRICRNESKQALNACATQVNSRPGRQMLRRRNLDNGARLPAHQFNQQRCRPLHGTQL